VEDAPARHEGRAHGTGQIGQIEGRLGTAVGVVGAACPPVMP
jgi:hypothetical protein